jgi:hypothetical protein
MKSKPFGVYSLIFAIVPLVLMLFFFVYKFMSTILMVFGAIALVFGIVGLTLARKESDKSVVIMSIIGIVISLAPLIIGLLLSPLTKGM